MSIQHLLCTRHCASALESHQYTSFCPQQEGRLAGKTNMPTDDQQIIFKYCKKKKKERDWIRIALLRTELGCIQSQFNRMGCHWGTTDKCGCYFHNSKNNTPLGSWKSRSIRRLFSGSQLQLHWGTPPWGALLMLISIAIHVLCKGEQVALLLYGPKTLYSLVDGVKY